MRRGDRNKEGTNFSRDRLPARKGLEAKSGSIQRVLGGSGSGFIGEGHTGVRSQLASRKSQLSAIIRRQHCSKKRQKTWGHYHSLSILLEKMTKKTIPKVGQTLASWALLHSAGRATDLYDVFLEDN